MSASGIRSSLAALLAALTFGAPATSAQVAHDDVIRPHIIIPQQRRPAPRPGEVVLTHADASVRINEQAATTSLVLKLNNPASSPQEAQVLLPVPTGATVVRFEVDGLGDEGVARVLPRDEARRIYQDIVRTMKDPGLVEFAGSDLIRTSVFPIAANSDQTVRLTYEQVLTSDAGRVDYVLPRSQSLSGDVATWTFDADISSSRPIATVYSPGHDLTTERISPTRVRVAVPADSMKEPGSVQVSYLVQQDQGVSASLIAYPDPRVADGSGGYFMLLAGLPEAPPAHAQPVPREVTIVLDRSGSMRGEKIEQAREAAMQIVAALKPDERFNIIDYSNQVEMFSPRPVVKNDKTQKQAFEYLKLLTAGGGTNIHDALLEALRQEPTEGTLPVVLFLTDGLPTVGITKELDIRTAADKGNAHERRVFAFGVGYDVNAPLLDAISKGSRGTSTYVRPEEDVEVKVGQVFARLSGPVLALPKLTALDADGNVTTRAVREMMPGEIPDLFKGEQLVVLGQYTADEPIHLKLAGEYFGTAREFEMNFKLDRASVQHSFVPRLWASRKIASLIEGVRRAGAETTPGASPVTDELVQEIIALSMEWGILTEYTAFLATEAERAPMVDSYPSADGLYRHSVNSVRDQLEDRAAGARVGRGSVNQSLNTGQMALARAAPAAPAWLDEDMNEVRLLNVQACGDRTAIRCGETWVDSNILAKGFTEEQAQQLDADETVEFATDRYFEVVDVLCTTNRQSLLSMGDALIELDGKRILVQGPRG